jgi:hypothetical protein
MSAYRFAAACVGAIAVIAVAVALTYPFSETNDGNLSKSAKLTVSRSQPECPNIAWPYGCEWRPAYLNDPRLGSGPTG